MSKKHLIQTGYTITELMIVLAISGSMVVAAYASINGQKRSNEFTQAVRDLENKITDVANDTVKGYFPNVGNNQKCNATPTGIQFDSNTSVEQGASEDCIFAGKALTASPSDSKFQLRTLVARRSQTNGDEVYTIDDLKQNDIRPAAWLDEDLSLVSGLHIKNIKYGPASLDVASIAFLSNFASRTGGGAGELSGAPTADLRWVLATPPNDLNLPTSYNPVLDNDGIRICVTEDGVRNALVHVGQERSLLSVHTEFDVSC